MSGYYDYYPWEANKFTVLSTGAYEAQAIFDRVLNRAQVDQRAEKQREKTTVQTGENTLCEVSQRLYGTPERQEELYEVNKTVIENPHDLQTVT